MSSTELKVTLVGDSGCGKSSVFYALQEEPFEELHFPTVFEFCRTTVWLKNSESIQLTLYDTAGAVEYKKLRLQSYIDCDVVAVCYDLSNPESIRNVYSKWVPELKQYCPGKPFCLVGCKKDLVAGNRAEMSSLGGDSELSSSDDDAACGQVQAAANSNALGDYQCSAKAGKSIMAMFTAAIEAQMELQKKNSRRHTLGHPGFSSPKLSVFRKSSLSLTLSKKKPSKQCRIM